MYLKINPQLSQKLKLSPQMIQSIGLLSLSVTELEEAVRKELEENPILEEKRDLLEEQSSLESDEAENLMDWTQYNTSLTSIGVKESTQQNFERNAPASETLKDHLIWQISLSSFSDQERKILLSIVHEINDDGYLQESVEQLAEQNQQDPKEVERLLYLLQEFDPSGVGARNLKECLIIQARRLEEDTKDFVRFIQDHLEDIQTKNYKRPAKMMGLELDEIKDMVKMISGMEPKPGRLFSTHQTQYVVPDIFITKKRDGSYTADVNEEGIPQIRIASHYTQFLNQEESLKGKSAQAQEFLIEKMKRALAFIRSMNQRRKTVLQLANMIAQEQKDFFDQGEKFLRPLLLKEMSERLGVHISTVSRLTSNKFVHTPQGVFELKHFFGISYLNKKGERLSTSAIQALIQKIVKEEKTPLSDERIAQQLYDKEGVNLSRRQVTRLREEANIPSKRHR